MSDSEQASVQRAVPKKDRLLKLLVAAGIVGISLIFLSSVWKKPESASSADSSPISAGSVPVEEYRQALSEELGNMVASIKGAGKTKIMLTMDGTVRSLYASDNDLQQRESSRRNSADENADKQTTEKRSLITIRSKDGSEQAVRIGEMMPLVRGVLVVCEGGDDEQVRKRITEAVSAALNISSSHICVTKGTL